MYVGGGDQLQDKRRIDEPPGIVTRNLRPSAFDYLSKPYGHDVLSLGSPLSLCTSIAHMPYC